jgi:thiazole/oxazole-forming peptide maturase SagD family component
LGAISLKKDTHPKGQYVTLKGDPGHMAALAALLAGNPASVSAALLRQRSRSGNVRGMDDFGAAPLIRVLDSFEVSNLTSQATGSSPALMALTSRFSHFLKLSSPLAPGLECIGGAIQLTAPEQESVGASIMSATGTALTEERAALLCLGETADLLSPLERPGDVIDHAEGPDDLTGWIQPLLLKADRPIDCVSGLRCVDGAPALLPADLCLRRPSSKQSITPIGPLSSGVAAGVDRASALCRAILELIERDAAAMWWFGGCQGREFAKETTAWEAATATLENLRQGMVLRKTLLIDITTDLGIPVVAAVSQNPDGRGLAVGIAARLSMAEAATSAITEMAQAELAAGLAQLKLSARGAEGLTAIDRRHLERHSAEAASVPQLRIAPAIELPQIDVVNADGLVRHLEAMNVPIFAVDLTRNNIGVPVLRALSPNLQPFSLDEECERFVRSCSEARPTVDFSPY